MLLGLLLWFLMCFSRVCLLLYIGFMNCFRGYFVSCLCFGDRSHETSRSPTYLSTISPDVLQIVDCRSIDSNVLAYTCSRSVVFNVFVSKQ
jgi:hypothetical protein